MKVKELIAKLSACDPNAELTFYCDYIEYDITYVDIEDDGSVTIS